MANFTPQQIEEFLQEFFDVVGTRQYIGARYVPIFGRQGESSIAWDNSAPYEPLTIVLHQGNSYTSRQYVPAGIDILNEAYWANTGNYNSQVEQYRQEVQRFAERVDVLDTLLPVESFDATHTVNDKIEEVAGRNVSPSLFAVVSVVYGEANKPKLFLTNFTQWYFVKDLSQYGLTGDAWNCVEADGWYYLTTSSNKYWSTKDFVNFDEHYYPYFVLPNSSTTNAPSRAPKLQKLATGYIFTFNYSTGENLTNVIGESVEKTIPIYYQVTPDNGELTFEYSTPYSFAFLSQSEGYMDLDIYFETATNVYYMLAKSERLRDNHLFYGSSLSNMSYQNMLSAYYDTESDCPISGFEAAKFVKLNDIVYAYDAGYDVYVRNKLDNSDVISLPRMVTRKPVIYTANRRCIKEIKEVVKTPYEFRHPCYCLIPANIVKSIYETYDVIPLESRYFYTSPFFRNSVTNSDCVFAPIPDAHIRFRSEDVTTEAPYYLRVARNWKPVTTPITVQLSGFSANNPSDSANVPSVAGGNGGFVRTGRFNRVIDSLPMCCVACIETNDYYPTNNNKYRCIAIPIYGV